MGREKVHAGRRTYGADLIALEFRRQALEYQVEALCRRLTRLRAAILAYLESLDSDKGSALQRLRHELSRRGADA